MKRILLLITINFIFITSYAQLVYNTGFSNSVAVTCPGNANVSVQGFPEWEFYQTYNDEWDGVKDSSICISVVPINFVGCKIALDQIDTNRRLFIASKVNYTSGSYLPPHIVYNLPLNVEDIGAFAIQIGLDSSSAPESFVLAIINIPDSTGVDSVFRYQKYALDPVDTPSWFSYTYNTCLSSEKFETQHLRQIIAGLKFSSVNNTDTLHLESFGPDYYNYAQLYSEVDVPEYLGNYDVTLGDSYNPSLIIYDDTTYPGPGHIDYALVKPVPDPGYPVNMVIHASNAGGLIFEPFTQLKAAEVNGQPGVYHTFTLINDGGEVCVNVVELIFHGGDEFVYQSGKINMNSTPSCFRIMNGGTFHILAGSEFNYGSQNHSGILLLNDAAQLDIDPGATLNIYNRMMLREEHPENGPKQFYMTLNPGATLRFMPGSHLTNLYSADNSIRLNVFMKGGLLDDSGLPSADKLLIKKIYADALDIDNPLQCYPNPAQTQVTINCMGEIMNGISIINDLGIRIVNINQSIYESGIDLCQWSRGIYTIKCSTPAGEYVRRLIVE